VQNRSDTIAAQEQGSDDAKISLQQMKDERAREIDALNKEHKRDLEVRFSLSLQYLTIVQK
jgi:hypothetical protein